MTPNLFVLGAGKSGTTTLYRLLEQIDDVHVTAPKEPSFFCSYFRVVDDPISYLSLFESNARWRCDCSHVYLSNPESAPAIRALFPEATFILIFRDPVQRAYSLYQHMRRAIHADGEPLEPAETFEAALQLESNRLADDGFRRTCRQYYWNFLYAESSRYDVQLERYLALFDRDQFHFLSLAEMSKSPSQCAHDVATRLAVELPQDLSFEPANVAPTYLDMSPESHKLLTERLDGVTHRVERLVGREMDWSL